MGLLDAVIGMLGNQGQSGPTGLGAGGGGQLDLMRIVAALLAGSGGQGSGGLGALIEQFQRSGLGDVVGSWVGTGQNLPVSPDQLSQIFGRGELDSLTQQTGLSQGDLLSQLSQILPQMVDRATPEGRVPDGGLGDVGAILSRFG